MKHLCVAAMAMLAACEREPASDTAAASQPASEKTAAERLQTMSDADKRTLNATPITSEIYPGPPEPNFGPEYGSIEFVDTDPGVTIGGVLRMKPAVDTDGQRIDETATGITTYMIHWGLEVGAPGVEDDRGAGDLGGDCMGFRDTGHVVMMAAAETGDIMEWNIPKGTAVPEGAVYFVGHTLYGPLHNLAKCTQTPINNLIR